MHVLDIHVESIPHLFFHCTHVRQIWLNIETILRNITGQTIKLRCQDVIFGFRFDENPCKENHRITNIILIMKMFIWHCKKSTGIVSIAHQRNWLRSRLSYDKEIAEICEQFDRIFTYY
jgi:hypothetical protein